MSTTSFLSKIDVNIQELNPTGRIENTVNLHLDQETVHKDFNYGIGNYSKCIRVLNGEYICYQFSHNYSVLSLYTLKDAINGKTIVIHLPTSSLNEHHTFTIREVSENLTMDLILDNGIFLNMSFPLEYIFSKTKTLLGNWFTVLNPYDFTVRRPHFMCPVSETFSVVFLNDGGLLGLTRKYYENGELEINPTLFNDNSYLQSFTKIFSSRRQDTKYNNVVSCVIFAERFLITLTQNCKLKVWDLNSHNITLEMSLAMEDEHQKRIYETLGEYLSLYDNSLAIFLPFDNGVFQIWRLQVDNSGKLVLNPSQSISATLSSSSIWSLVDMKFTKPLDINAPSSYANLIVLWKSNTIVKLQVLNFQTENLESYRWIEACNRSLVDLRSDHDLLTNGNTKEALLNLKTHYTPFVFREAQKILSANGILMVKDSPYNQDFLTNLESVLKDLKKHNDEPCSLTLYQDDMVMINSMRLYTHSLYKINSTLENIFYTLNEELDSEDQLATYLRTINGFASTLSTQVIADVSDAFINMSNSSYPSNMSLKDKFTNIFSSILEGQFQMSNLRTLFESLSSLNVVDILNNLIDNHLKKCGTDQNLVDSIMFDNFTTVAMLESVNQSILIQNQIVLQVLLTFAFMDFDDSVFTQHINTLLLLNYKQCLWIRLYQLNKPLLITEIFTRTSKFGFGAKFFSYADWLLYVNTIVKEIYDMPISPNPLFLESFDRYVVNNSDDKESSELFLELIQLRFYIRSSPAHEFMMGLTFFMCGNFEKAYEFLQKHNYPEILPKELPDRLYLPLQKDGHLWREVIESFKLPNKQAAYFYRLSKLFSLAKSYSYALGCIKKSIKLSAQLIDIKESSDFQVAQLTQYLDTLIIFKEFEEVLDVLRFSSVTLPDNIRAEYYTKLLTGQYRDSFVATLLTLCSTRNELYLPIEDFIMVDQILEKQKNVNDWETYKRIFSFRFVNQHERTAAEILYDCIMHGASSELKNKCYLMIVNILQSFTDENDQWILANGILKTLSDLKLESQHICN
ncbi:LAFE_0F07228g1_1 [Lachancea fermentati]|uniref:LAFE_0F07228g1_1 n=1 Tax=Lachancea fermentati TaxID=4955 RepID=A0A1G4MEX4_LACFM|nr:LAFE_0F07228g1_1 [Lachancea fermentati]